MKKLLFLIAFCFILPAIPQEKQMNETEKKLNEIKQKHIPDTRLAVFHITTHEENGNKIISGATNLPEVKSEIEQVFSGSEYKTDIELLPSKNLSDKLFGVINLSVANIRTKPDHAAELATQALLGQPVKVFQKKGGWYLVQTPDKYVAWCDDDGVELMNDKELMQWKTAKKIIYTLTSGFSYSEMDANSVPVGDLVKGDILKWISDEGDFIKVEYPDKRIAFVSSSESEYFDKWIADLNPTAENILSNAYSLMGIPYLWGGTSVKGMDCSGFTKTVYFNNGIILSRDASQQVLHGKQIDISEGFDKLLPGDLLFFGSKATDTTKERVTHVAIYIGNNDFIHASGRVRINSLDKNKDNFSSYRFNTLLRAKRILNAAEQNGTSEVKNLFNINGVQP
jgi:gamma-D-glutamyl-L-lysine dipeptidyl-peptidase